MEEITQKARLIFVLQNKRTKFAHINVRLVYLARILGEGFSEGIYVLNFRRRVTNRTAC